MNELNLFNKDTQDLARLVYFLYKCQKSLEISNHLPFKTVYRIDPFILAISIGLFQPKNQINNPSKQTGSLVARCNKTAKELTVVARELLLSQEASDYIKCTKKPTAKVIKNFEKLKANLCQLKELGLIEYCLVETRPYKMSVLKRESERIRKHYSEVKIDSKKLEKKQVDSIIGNLGLPVQGTKLKESFFSNKNNLWETYIVFHVNEKELLKKPFFYKNLRYVDLVEYEISRDFEYYWDNSKYSKSEIIMAEYYLESAYNFSVHLTKWDLDRLKEMYGEKVCKYLIGSLHGKNKKNKNFEWQNDFEYLKEVAFRNAVKNKKIKCERNDKGEVRYRVRGAASN